MNSDFISKTPATDGSDPVSTDDLLRRILQEAGHRPAVPTEDAALVRTAAFAEWKRTVQRERQRKRFLKVGGLLAAAAVLLLALNFGLLQRMLPVGPQAVAYLEVSQGSVAVLAEPGRPEANLAIAELGQTLLRGSRIETAHNGTGNRALLRLRDGQTVRLDVDTQLTLHSSSELELHRGTIYVDSAEAAPDKAVAIQTVLGVTRDIGTRFEVRYTPEEDVLRVRVREGAVALERDGSSHFAAAGIQLIAEAGGTVSETPVPAHGPIWDWTRQLLPDFAVEGLLLRTFLEWAALEAGWELQFADPGLEAQVSSVTLHGSIRGLSLDEALELAFLSSGLDLDYLIQDGHLIIQTPER